MALRVLAAENYPAQRTLCDFRALHLQELSALFVQVVRLARECGLVKLGTVAVDGTKLKAQIDGLLNRAQATDDLERNDSVLDILAEIKRREDRLAAITAAMDAKLKTPQGQAAYRKRKWIVEAPNGWIKSVLGFRQFSLRGLEKVKAEFKLVCLALNLRRMCRLRRA